MECLSRKFSDFVHTKETDDINSPTYFFALMEFWYRHLGPFIITVFHLQVLAF